MKYLILKLVVQEVFPAGKCFSGIRRQMGCRAKPVLCGEKSPLSGIKPGA